MYNQIHYHQGLFDMIKREKIPMIHLMRKNLVKQVISGLNAATTEHKSIIVSPKQLMDMVKEADNQNKNWSKKMNDHIKLTLYYEDIIGASRMGRTYASNNTIIAVCRFFNASQYQLFATTKKKNKSDLRVYLPNYNEIKKYFKNTKYEWMIKDKEK
jgi:allophanate hydrolase subunit 1